MKANEKKLLLLFGALFGLVLVVRVVPLIVDYYQAGRQDMRLLEERVERYQNLITDTDVWKEREALKQAEIADLQSWIFTGSNPSLVGSSVQRSLRQAVDQAGINVREMSVARYSYMGDWLLVSQDMSFIVNQENILPFLQALNALRPRLHVAAFTVTHNRRQYTGNITVVGFSAANTGQPLASNQLTTQLREVR